MNKQYDLRALLDEINPATLDYQQWIDVGMALKHEGLTADDWEKWSSRDSRRYHMGECQRKWESFNGSTNPVTGGTIVQYAMDQGYTPLNYREDRELDWDDIISEDRDESIIIDHNWIEEVDVPTPDDDWNPAKELIRYLETLFEAGENVGYVTQSWQKEDKYLPTRGCWDRTAGELIEALTKCDGDIGSVLGDYNPEAGAWIRFNPLDGKGCKNENVTDYRYALVESDKLDIERQHAIIQNLEIPVAILVHSGKRSLHAIVRINATNYEEYRKRVDYLYKICQKNGLEIDAQNRNPSRLSRLPGAIRNGNKQYIVATNIGMESYDSWREWTESVNDDLPETENLEDIWDKIPPLEPVLIDGVLRQGHKMLLAGPSKAGKSYALIELCIAIAEGMPWMGWKCTQGRVLYVNLELASASCWNRLKDVYSAMGIKSSNNRGNLDVWNLRGKSLPMDKLAPKLIRRAAKRKYIAIVIDPIYKVITGDENSADQMAKFCNQFDLLCTELGCAVIYCHHHSKGLQGQKRSMDRASGSGVFARDPDAMLDMIQLTPTDALIKQETDKAGIAALKRELLKLGLEETDATDIPKAISSLRCKYPLAAVESIEQAIERAQSAAKKRTAWRIEGTLREFEKFSPVNLWFDYPIHLIDDVGSLGDIEAEGEAPPWKKATVKRKEGAKIVRDEMLDSFKNALKNANFGEPPTKSQVAAILGVSERTVGDRLKKYSNLYTLDKNNGNVIIQLNAEATIKT